MDTHLLGAPLGFQEGVVALNKLATSGRSLETFIESILTSSDREGGVLPAEFYIEQFLTVGIDVNEAELQNSMRAVQYIYRGARAHEVSGDELKESLEGATDFSEACIAILTEAWTSSDAARAAGLSDVLSLGRLVSMDWKVGVTVETSACKKAAAPFVTLLLHVADNSNVVTQHVVELALADFHRFSAAFRDIAASMATL
eukprot:PLAT6928.3.p2 GENE.PLAT6928.3~~PLAT6928.3.p2  ORF type:complete len:201 (-),score=87.85 PLAT6928.3:146-748(-)